LGSNPFGDNLAALVDDLEQFRHQIQNQRNNCARRDGYGTSSGPLARESAFLLRHADRIGDALRREAGAKRAFQRGKRIDGAAGANGAAG